MDSSIAGMVAATKASLALDPVSNVVDGAADMEATVSLTEKVRGRHLDAVKKSRHPIKHTLTIRPAA